VRAGRRPSRATGGCGPDRVWRERKTACRTSGCQRRRRDPQSAVSRRAHAFATILRPFHRATTLHSEFPMDDVVEPAQPEQTAQQPTDEWARIFEGLRQRFPGASEGVLFCIHKLQQNPDVKLRDFKEEAALHGVSLSGRSHYSARVMLGLEPPPPPRGKKA